LTAGPGVRDFDWARRDARLGAFSVSAVSGIPKEEVVRRFEADPGTAVQTTFEASFNGYPEPTYIVVDEAPGGILVFENNGWRGVEEHMPARLSAGGRSASYYRSVNADMTLTVAADGQVVAAFDPLLDRVPPELAELARGLDFGPHDCTASALALVVRCSGVQIDSWWLDATHVRYEVAPPG